MAPENIPGEMPASDTQSPMQKLKKNVIEARRSKRRIYLKKISQKDQINRGNLYKVDQSCLGSIIILHPVIIP